MRRRARAVPFVVALVLSVVWGVAGASGSATADDGAPTGSISGRVTVPAGVDVTRVQVNVWRTDLSGYGSTAVPTADGTYTVAGLAPGGYRVEFLGWGAGLVLEYWNDSQQFEGASIVTVGSGPVTGVDAALTLGASLSGTIRTNSDCDLTGVLVRLWFGAPGMYPDAVVEPGGQWSLRGLRAGTYGIQFDGRWVGLPEEFWRGSSTLWTGVPVLALAPGETRTGIDITLNGPRGCVGTRPYVVSVYRDLLKRDPDPLGLNSWANALAWGAPHASVANGITASDEYRARLVSDTYRRYLGRGPDPVGLASWLAAMRTGGQIEEIQAGFVSSEEFYARYGSTPAGWVTGLYQTVLGRGASSLEIQDWVRQLMAGATRREVARGFLYSTEHLAAVVDGYYVDLLGRHLDAVGRTTWVGRIQAGHRDEEIVAGILASQEYLTRARATPWPGP